ncbi:MAG: PAS domain S-box protein [Pirellulaceae bacterium]|nr:PAS domain S-box protein [Pirellulaceae bacterium]
MQSIVSAVVDAVLSIDEHGLILSANRATGEMFGYTIEELIGKNVSQLMPEPFRREHDMYIQRYLETGCARIIGRGRELTGQRKDGSLFPIDLSVSQISQTRTFTGIVRDVSARRKLQQHVLELASEQQRRIGHHLQENIGQELTGISLLAHTLKAIVSEASKVDPSSLRLSEPEYNRLQLVLDRLASGVSTVVRNVEQLSKRVMPVQIDSQGFVAALYRLNSETIRLTGLKCKLDCELPLEIHNNTVATHVYRIAQEAVEHAVQRPAVTCITMRISQDGEELVIEIIDDASHCKSPMVEAGCKPTCTRLASEVMRYRAGLIGGRITETLLQPAGHSIELRIHLQSLASE